MHRRRSLLLGIMAAVLALTGVAPASAGNPPSSPGGPVWRWDEITPAAPWAGRAGLQAVELGTSFYLMGGRTPVGFAPGVPPGASQLWSDVWRSNDRGDYWKVRGSKTVVKYDRIVDRTDGTKVGLGRFAHI